MNALRLIQGALAAVMAIGFSGQAGAQQPLVFGFSQPNMEHPYRVLGTNQARAWAAQNPSVQLVLADGRRDSAVQMQTIEDLIARKVNVIIMSPNDSTALVPIVEVIRKAGVPIVNFDRRLAVPDDQLAAYIGADDVEMGRMAARAMIEKIGTSGKVIQLEGNPGGSGTINRKKGFEEVMSKHPGIRIISYVANFRLHEAVAVMEDALTAHRDLKGVYGHNDSMAMGAVQVLEEKKIAGVTVVGIDGGEEGCHGVRSGKMHASVYYPTLMPQALDIALAVARGQPVPKITLLDTPLITSQTVDQICKK